MKICFTHVSVRLRYNDNETLQQIISTLIIISTITMKLKSITVRIRLDDVIENELKESISGQEICLF